MKLPDGWHYTPSKPPTECSECGHREDARPGTLRGPDGREWPLIGNRGPKQEREMVNVIVSANSQSEAA